MNLDRIIAVRNDKTVYRNLGRCLKIFDENYSKADVLSEALNNARAEETGLRVPKLLEVTVFDGKWVIVTEYISGKTLKQLMQEHPEKEDEYLELLAHVQNEIHNVEPPRLVSLDARLQRRLMMADISEDIRSRMIAKLSKFTADGHPKKMCHCDCMPSNLIISDDGEPYVIDWPHASLGDPAADAALTIMRFAGDGNAACAEKYTGVFSNVSGIDENSIKEWQPVIAAALMADANSGHRKLLREYIDV